MFHRKLTFNRKNKRKITQNHRVCLTHNEMSVNFKECAIDDTQNKTLKPIKSNQHSNEILHGIVRMCVHTLLHFCVWVSEWVSEWDNISSPRPCTNDWQHKNKTKYIYMNGSKRERGKNCVKDNAKQRWHNGNNTQTIETFILSLIWNGVGRNEKQKIIIQIKAANSFSNTR